MARLQIYLFGAMRVVEPDQGEIRFPSRKSKALLAYLVLQKRRVPRLCLAEQFWPEADEYHGKRALNTEFWRLRQSLKALGCEPDEYLYSDCDFVGFQSESCHWSDASAFDDAARALYHRQSHTPNNNCVKALADAVALYHGDLLEGFLDEWCLIEREGYRSRVVAALEFLHLTLGQEQRWPEAIGYAQQLLAIDPLLEHIHRSLMRSYAVTGNRPAALKQYARLSRVLDEELGVEPMNETRLLYNSILGGSMAHIPSHAAPETLMFRGRREPARKVTFARLPRHPGAGR